MTTALGFAGQGSQYVGMMKDIAESFSFARERIEYADKILGYELSSICFDGPAEKLKETRFTQPALFVHSAVIIDVLKEKLNYNAVAGHSVGEYAALYSAGVLSFEDALKLVSLRGELMFRAGETEPGTMFAVINMDDDKLEQVCNELTNMEKRNIIVPANYNSPGQVVVSGSAQYLRDNIGAFKAAGAKLVKELVVSGAFHSPLMMPAKNELEKAINNTDFLNAKVPVYTNVYAKPSTDAEELKKALILQLTSPVKWTQIMNEMKADDISDFIEIGPGRVLQGLMKRTESDININGIDTKADLEKYL